MSNTNNKSKYPLYIVLDTQNFEQQDSSGKRIVVLTIKAEYPKILYGHTIWYSIDCKKRRMDNEYSSHSTALWDLNHMLKLKNNDDGTIGTWKYFYSEQEFINEYGWILFI